MDSLSARSLPVAARPALVCRDSDDADDAHPKSAPGYPKLN
jgi:hypothetical protein